MLGQAGNAVTFGFSKDLGLVGGQFGNINTLFFVFFILFETPWVMAVKRFGPNKVLGTALVLWSIVTISTGFIRSYRDAIAVRMLLGACEAGVSPGFAYLFATIYDRSSAAKRIVLGNLTNTVAGAFGGLFAYAIQTMGERRGIAGQCTKHHRPARVYARVPRLTRRSQRGDGYSSSKAPSLWSWAASAGSCSRPRPKLHSF